MHHSSLRQMQARRPIIRSGHYQRPGDNLQLILALFIRDLLGEARGRTHQFGDECGLTLAVVKQALHLCEELLIGASHRVD